MKTYELWTEKRKLAVKQHLERHKKMQLLKEIEEKKECLQKREDVIFFFDNQEKLELLLAQKEYVLMPNEDFVVYTLDFNENIIVTVFLLVLRRTFRSMK